MRAIHIVSTTALCFTFLPVLADTLTCNSSSDSYKHCSLPRANERDINITNVNSGSCDMNNTWGVDRTGVWVDHGCGADFNYSDFGPVNGGGAVGQTNVYVEPDYAYGYPEYGFGSADPFFWPGFFYDAGFFFGPEYYGNGWYGNEYCAHHGCNNYYNNYNHNYNPNNNPNYHPYNNAYHPNTVNQANHLNNVNNANVHHNEQAYHPNNANTHYNQQSYHPQHEDEEGMHEHDGEESHEHEGDVHSYHGRRGGHR